MISRKEKHLNKEKRLTSSHYSFALPAKSKYFFYNRYFHSAQLKAGLLDLYNMQLYHLHQQDMWPITDKV